MTMEDGKNWRKIRKKTGFGIGIDVDLSLKSVGRAEWMSESQWWRRNFVCIIVKLQHFSEDMLTFCLNLSSLPVIFFLIFFLLFCVFFCMSWINVCLVWVLSFFDFIYYSIQFFICWAEQSCWCSRWWPKCLEWRPRFANLQQ